MKELKILENSYKEILSNVKHLYNKTVSDLLLHKVVEFNYEWSNPFDEVFNDKLLGKVEKLTFDNYAIFAYITIIDVKKSKLVKTNDEVCINVKKIIRLHNDK